MQNIFKKSTQFQNGKIGVQKKKEKKKEKRKRYKKKIQASE